MLLLRRRHLTLLPCWALLLNWRQCWAHAAAQLPCGQELLQELKKRRLLLLLLLPLPLLVQQNGLQLLQLPS